MKAIHFFVEGHPESYNIGEEIRWTGGRWRTGKPYIHHFPTPRHQQWQETVIIQARPHAPEEPWDGGVSFTMIFRLQKGKSVPKVYSRCRTILSKAHCRAPIKKPDLTRVVRVTEDALTLAGFWTDDSRVVKQTNEAHWCKDGEPEGVTITVEFDA